MASYEEWVLWGCVSLVAIVLVEIWLKNRRLPPGPWGLPFFGYYFFVDLFEPYKTFHELHKKYGDVYSFRTLGGTLFVVLNTVSVMKEVFATRSDEFIGRPLQQNFINWIDGGHGLAQAEGEIWKEQKKFFATAVKQYGFGKTDLEGLIQETIQEMLSGLRQVSKKPISLAHHLSHVTSNSISKVLSNKRISQDDKKFLELRRAIPHIAQFFANRSVLIVGPLLDCVFFPLTSIGRSMKNAKKLLDKYTEETLQEHIRTLDPSNPRDFTDTYLLHMKKTQGNADAKNNSFDMERLTNIFLTILNESTETVSATINALLLGLAEHLDVQKKAQKQLDGVVGRNRLPSWMDKKNLPYIDAMIMELYRTSIIFYISTYYSNFEETTLRGYRIPKRSIIIANFYSVHNNPEIYPNPSRFDPGRFLGEEGQRIKQEPPIAFGIGKRSCLGESLATMEVFLIITSILQSFNLYPAGEGKVRLEPRTEI